MYETDRLFSPCRGSGFCNLQHSTQILHLLVFGHQQKVVFAHSVHRFFLISFYVELLVIFLVLQIQSTTRRGRAPFLGMLCSVV